jgi:hypothetical protein
VRPLFYSNLFVITPTDVHIFHFFFTACLNVHWGGGKGGGVYDRYVDITANRRNFPANKHLVGRGWGGGGGEGGGWAANQRKLYECPEGRGAEGRQERPRDLYYIF